MTPPDPTAASAATTKAAATAPRPRWWGRLVTDGNPPRPRLVVRWGRIATVVFSLGLFAYLGLATALWSYYVVQRKIPGVNWIDVVILPRFSRVQRAIGDYYFAQAKDEWTKKDFVRAIFTGRAAVVKAPANLDARLFLAGCWLEVGRPDEAVRTVHDGLAFNATDPRLQVALVRVCLDTSHFKELLEALRTDFPAHGVQLLDGRDRGYQLAEIRAVLETARAAEADQLVNQYPGLASDPTAAPLLAEIEWQLGRHDAAFARLGQARSRAPSNPTVQDAYADIAMRLGQADEARRAAAGFLQKNPRLLPAQLRFLEAFGSRKGEDERPWTAECFQFLAQHQHDASACGRLASLAASKGWTDVTYLLYQNSLQENLSGFPFVIYYAASLVKAGQLSEADRVWRELSVRNGQEIVSATYIAAMVDWGTGRESDALPIVDQLRRDSAGDRHRRRVIEGLFRDYGYPKLADLLSKPAA